MSGLLEGIRVLELASTLMGPFCGFQLAELGADVIKIEEPGGDVVRRIGQGRDPLMGPIFMNANRGKRSIELDLKQESARSVLDRLVAEADVFLHNLRPAAAARLSVTATDLMRVNSRLVHCSLTGFGAGGRYRDLAAYDDVIQAASGLAASQGSTDEDPTYVRSALADKIVATAATTAITAALYRRERTGAGAAIEVPMFETMVAFHLLELQGGRVFDPPTGPVGYARVASQFRRPYRALDGHIAVVVYTDRQWAAFFELIGRSDLTFDSRFSSIAARTEHIDELYAIVEQQIARRTIAEWLTALEDHNIPALPVNTLDSLFDDPHLADVGLFRNVDHPTEGRIVVTRSGVVVDGHTADPSQQRPAPRLGEHTAEILAELGLDPSTIAAPEARTAISVDRQ